MGIQPHAARSTHSYPAAFPVVQGIPAAAKIVLPLRVDFGSLRVCFEDEYFF